MPMLIKRENNMEFPSTGDHTTLLKRLSEYIHVFDPIWIEKIKPASQEQIALFEEISQLKKWTTELPEPYLIFLESMGIEDGGLLSKSLGGTANIEEMIDLYKEFQKFDPEVFDTPYLAFFDKEMGGEYSIDLSGKYSDHILESDSGEVYEVISKNFETMLFQAAFNKFERFCYTLYFGVSEHNLRNRISMYGVKNVFLLLDKVTEKYGLKLAWFSDTSHYIALGTNLSFGVEKMERTGMCGFVTGEKQKIVKQLANDIIHFTNVEIDLEEW